MSEFRHRQPPDEEADPSTHKETQREKIIKDLIEELDFFRLALEDLLAEEDAPKNPKEKKESLDKQLVPDYINRNIPEKILEDLANTPAIASILVATRQFASAYDNIVERVYGKIDLDIPDIENDLYEFAREKKMDNMTVSKRARVDMKYHIDEEKVMPIEVATEVITNLKVILLSSQRTRDDVLPEIDKEKKANLVECHKKALAVLLRHHKTNDRVIKKLLPLLKDYEIQAIRQQIINYRKKITIDKFTKDGLNIEQAQDLLKEKTKGKNLLEQDKVLEIPSPDPGADRLYDYISKYKEGEPPFMDVLDFLYEDLPPYLEMDNQVQN